MAQPSSCKLVLSHNDSCSGAMNFAVADLGAVNIILGLDFLKVYGAIIDLRAD